MIIESKFKVNDLVKQKFSNCGNKFHAFEVAEVLTQTCYAGTQCFYQCRAIIASKEYDNNFNKSAGFTWDIFHGISSQDGGLGWQKLREDELIELTEEEAAIFKQNEQA